MAGSDGYVHNCSETKVEKIKYRKSLKESGFTDEECNKIWDFYVSRSFAAQTGLSISLESYGWKDTMSKTDGLPALESKLASCAGFSQFIIIRSKTIKDTLANLDLSNGRICIAHPRAVMLQNYSYLIDENENVKLKSDESRITAIFRHIRNALAHGNTYFFDNDMCLMEDKDGNKTTASILIARNVLLDWISIIEKA